ncbi:MAG: carbohydrate ABC transporter permease [Angelakisella sp.]
MNNKTENSLMTVQGNKYRRSAMLYKAGTLLFTVIAIGFALVTLYPYFFSLIASLRKGVDIYTPGWKWSDLSLYAYQRILNTGADEAFMLPRWMLNTFGVAAATTLLTLLISAMGGYALARIDFVTKKLWFAALLGVMMIPGQVTLIPKYIMIAKVFGWTNSYVGLVIPFIFSADYTFMMRQFFLSFPKELEEAAIMDGMSRLGVFVKMVLPLSKAPMLAAGTLIFMGSWSSYLWPKLLINKLDMYMVSQGMTVMMGTKYTASPAISMAAAIVSMLPLILLFIIFQKQFIASIASTGTKGS